MDGWTIDCWGRGEGRLARSLPRAPGVGRVKHLISGGLSIHSLIVSLIRDFRGRRTISASYKGSFNSPNTRVNSDLSTTWIPAQALKASTLKGHCMLGVEPHARRRSAYVNLRCSGRERTDAMDVCRAGRKKVNTCVERGYYNHNSS